MSLPTHQHPPRLVELDSLRGLAALVVFSSHALILLPRHPHWLLEAFSTPAVLLLMGGHQAVLLFFLLSGFVLYLPYTRNPPSPAPYLPYVAKRLCRIYLPYLASVLFVLAAYSLTYLPLGTPRDISVFYSWRPLSARQMLILLAHHILFLGSFHREYWNPSTWSLAEELRISLIFPLLATLLRRHGWRVALAVALAASTIAALGIRILHHSFPLLTLHYAGLFLLGAILSAHHPQLIRAWQHIRRPGQLLLILLGIFLATNPALFTGPIRLPEEAGDWLMALGCATFLIASISHTWFSRLLRHPLMEHLGRISYSFYLLHLPWLLTLATLFWNRLPHALLFLLALLLTLLTAELFFRYVERPSIALGRHLALRFRST